jgi:hypothetical protein
MKLVVVMVTVLLVIVMIAGCSSRVQTPSNVTTQAPGAVIPVTVEASPAAIVPVGPTYMSPDNETPNNTRHNDVFFLEPVKDYHVGDQITLQGITILAAGDPLLVEVVSSSFGPAPKSSRQSFTGVSGIATVNAGPPGGSNTWTFSFPTDGFIEDTYIVTVSGITINVRDSTTFLLKPQVSSGINSSRAPGFFTSTKEM